jgi:predicted PurR-regulated permease PerM
MEKEKNTLDISWETIFKIFVAVVIFYILYLVRDILTWFIFAIIISMLVEPVLEFLQKKRIPRVAASVFIYLLIFGSISFFVYSTIPVFISEFRQFAQVFPRYFEKIAPPLRGLGFQAFQDLSNFVDFLSQTLEKNSANILETISAIFGGILSTFFIFSVAFFISLEEKPIEKILTLIFPKRYEAYALNLWQRAQKRVSGWFLSRIIGSLFVGLVSFVTFLAFKTRYPFSLALLAGIFDFIPVIGPLIVGILVFIVVSLDNFAKSIFVIIVFILIHQIESNVVFPLLAKKFVDLSPVVVIFALTIGGVLWGFWGAILAIPLFGILSEFFRDFLKKRRGEETVVL